MLVHHLLIYLIWFENLAHWCIYCPIVTMYVIWSYTETEFCRFLFLKRTRRSLILMWWIIPDSYVMDNPRIGFSEPWMPISRGENGWKQYYSIERNGRFGIFHIYEINGSFYILPNSEWYHIVNNSSWELMDEMSMLGCVAYNDSIQSVQRHI
jgi:hypothetical protein